MAYLLKALRKAELYLAILVLGAIVAVVFAGTVGRYGGRPVLWSDEVAQALFPWLVFLAADLTLQRRGHFRIDFAVKPLPVPLQVALELAIKLMLLALLVLLVHFGIKLVGISQFRPLPMTGVSTAWAAAALPVGFALMLITIVEQTVALLRGEPVHDEAARDVM
ncbi:TRAP transporter small permease [Chelativorans salis]|uniref:TRAP transporter small permease protein n=1 Tax=Chelativorans salis TaxID=2978478 RepID=A0ABT2LRF1_9HYPH|nr:TRAP transporter small permease [Chelativorans sp. EGI FJ00035]MCT7377034.1 TRAP transporter small permease [Chelativorans sp. EGI FJ00035]